MEKYFDAFLRVSGAGAPGVLLTVILEIPIFIFSLGYNFARLNISFSLALVVSLFFLVCFFGLNLWALKVLPFERRDKILVKSGPYGLIRHPSYSAKIFLLLPGVAFLFRTWLPIVSLPLVMIIWNMVVEEEEKRLKNNFGKDFDQYCEKVGKFFPKIFNEKN